ncbi:MAG: gamma-glutamyltransferase [Thermosynechococcaceae cyanobacterium]
MVVTLRLHRVLSFSLRSLSLTFVILQASYAGAQPPTHSQQGMVTSAHPLASQAGLTTLQQGGNAVDAAVATTLTISVVEPFSAGIGGGGFLVLRLAKNNEIKALDFREKAPLKATRDLYLNAKGKIKPGASTDGHLAVAVPGTIAGLYEVHQKYGKLPWAQVVQPSIALAEDGFTVSDRLSQAIQRRQATFKQNSAARQIFLPQGQAPKTGDRLVQKDLAKTLKTLVRNPQSFYTGAVADAIATDMTQNGGLVSKKDLQTYKPTWREPVCGQFRQAKVCSMPPPSSGGVHLLQMLQMVENENFKDRWHHPDILHVLIESMKIAYADRATYLGDPDFVSVPTAELISPAYARLRRQEITAQARSATEVKAADPKVLEAIRQRKESNDTSHLTVVDKDRNAVSLTFTINLGFGAGVVAEGTGIVLNNEMDDFAAAPGVPNAFGLVGGEANAIAPGKIPLSSMTPTIVTENNKLRLATGAPGGSTIITTVLQTLINVLVYDQDAAQAMASPRLHHQWRPEPVMVERWGFDVLTLQNLQQRGHQMIMGSGWGNANLILVKPDGSLEGAADPRGDGIALGY